MSAPMDCQDAPNSGIHPSRGGGSLGQLMFCAWILLAGIGGQGDAFRNRRVPRIIDSPPPPGFPTPSHRKTGGSWERNQAAFLKREPNPSLSRSWRSPLSGLPENPRIRTAAGTQPALKFPTPELLHLLKRRQGSADPGNPSLFLLWRRLS